MKIKALIRECYNFNFPNYSIILNIQINFIGKSNNRIFLQIEIVDHLKDKVLKLLKEYN